LNAITRPIFPTGKKTAKYSFLLSILTSILYTINIDCKIDDKIDSKKESSVTMQNASAYSASYFAVGTPGGSAALCARLRLFPLKPLWTRVLRKIHHYTQGSALLSNRDKSLLLHYARWTRASFTIHPAAVFGSVVADRALTTRFAGLRQYASLQSSSLHSHMAIHDWAGRPTTESG